jgi:hypothetical protein
MFRNEVSTIVIVSVLDTTGNACALDGNSIVDQPCQWNVQGLISSKEQSQTGLRTCQLYHGCLNPAQWHPCPTLQTFSASSPVPYLIVSFWVQRKINAAVPTSSSLRRSFARPLPHFAEPLVVLPRSLTIRSAVSKPSSPLGCRKART